MGKIADGLTKFWSSFMTFNKQFDSTLFIVLTFWTLNKMLNMTGDPSLSEGALRIITEYASVFSHVLSAIVGALFMKAAMDSKNGDTQNHGDINK